MADLDAENILHLMTSKDYTLQEATCEYFKQISSNNRANMFAQHTSTDYVKREILDELVGLICTNTEAQIVVTTKQLNEWVASGDVKQYVTIMATLDPLAGLNWFYHPQGGGYGDRSMYDLPPGSTSWHAGLDLYTNGIRIGTPLYSAWSGTIVENYQFNDEHRARGNYVLIKLDKTSAGEEIYILMQHMNNVDVVPEQRVSPGDVLGAVGNTGVGSPNGHLHLEIMVGGITTNPDDPDSNEYFSIDPVNDTRALEILKPYPGAF